MRERKRMRRNLQIEEEARAAGRHAVGDRSLGSLTALRLLVHRDDKRLRSLEAC
jgi:hypothetical protein